ncbi:hypothetical protein B0H11DRAFT_1722699 [Mycena galericulata]|nr:hypothetical protein B0H11DRAFT_1722699 [Mycena galericulata]
MLCLKDRNKAIGLKLLQRYLSFGPSRPTWAPITDRIFTKNIPTQPVVPPETRKNPFLQTWTPLSRSIPEPCNTLLKTAKEFNVKFDCLDIDEELKKQLPIWFHIGADCKLSKLNISSASKCLRDVHGVNSVGDLMNYINRIDPNRAHYQRSNCGCSVCKSDRNRGCSKPFTCQSEAAQLLNCVEPKWDPRRKLNQPNPALTPEQKSENVSALTDKKPITFDPDITVKSDLSLAFRAFVKSRCHKRPADQMNSVRVNVPPHLTVFIGGTFIIDEDGEYQSGGGVWFAPDDPKNKPVGVPFNLMTRNSGELAAILHVIQTTSENVVLNFRLNSKYLVRKLTIDVPSLEFSGWTGDRDKTLISTIVAALR